MAESDVRSWLSFILTWMSLFVQMDWSVAMVVFLVKIPLIGVIWPLIKVIVSGIITVVVVTTPTIIVSLLVSIRMPIVSSVTSPIVVVKSIVIGHF